jgi:hypothetical protein
VAGVDQVDLEAAVLQDLEKRNPVDPPVASIATVVMAQDFSQSARASRSSVRVPKWRTGCSGSRS